MLWGILIGLGLTAIMVIVVVLLGFKDFKPLSYVVIVVALIAFSIEGRNFIKYYNEANGETSKVDKVADIVQTAIAYTGDDVQNYRLGIAEASLVKTALRFSYKDVAEKIEASDLVGKTISETVETLRKMIITDANKSKWMVVLYVGIILVVAILLTILSTRVGGGGKPRERSRDNSHDGSRRLHGRSQRRARRSSI